MKSAREILEDRDKSRIIEELSKKEASSLSDRFMGEVRKVLQEGERRPKQVFAKAMKSLAQQYERGVRF